MAAVKLVVYRSGFSATPVSNYPAEHKLSLWRFFKRAEASTRRVRSASDSSSPLLSCLPLLA